MAFIIKAIKVIKYNNIGAKYLPPLNLFYKYILLDFRF